MANGRNYEFTAWRADKTAIFVMSNDLDLTAGERLRLVAVSYLNTKPFLYGLQNGALSDRFELRLEIPSVCARLLSEGQADLGLVPVAALPELPQGTRIVSDFCIGACGAVRTVALFARQPVHSLKRIYLDYHSRTSVELLRFLLKRHWQCSPEPVPASPGFERCIEGDTGALVIGDRAIDLLGRFEYEYDLALHWQGTTGMPFVFAVWVCLRPLPPAQERLFNQALSLGINALPEVARLHQQSYPDFDLLDYYTRRIDYALDADKRRAMEYFLSLFSEKRLNWNQ